MYQEVYIDVVFAANLLMDYLLLRLVGRFLTMQCKPQTDALRRQLSGSSLFLPDASVCTCGKYSLY